MPLVCAILIFSLGMVMPGECLILELDSACSRIWVWHGCRLQGILTWDRLAEVKPLKRFFCAVANVAGFMFENLESTMTGADDNKLMTAPPCLRVSLTLVLKWAFSWGVVDFFSPQLSQLAPSMISIFWCFYSHVTLLKHMSHIQHPNLNTHTHVHTHTHVCISMYINK